MTRLDGEYLLDNREQNDVLSSNPLLALPALLDRARSGERLEDDGISREMNNDWFSALAAIPNCVMPLFAITDLLQSHATALAVGIVRSMAK